MVWTVCVISIAVTACAAFVTRPQKFDPFSTFTSPQTVVHRQAVYRPGDTVFVRATKCYNDPSKPIAFSGTSYWRRENPYRLVIQKASGYGVISPAELDSGCVTHTFANVIPKDLPDGVWHIEGQETARHDRDTVTAAWYTEPFRVKHG